MMDGLGGLGGTFWATLIGAIVGAVVGGTITLLIQINGVRIARNERLETKRQDDLATAFSAMVKVIKMLSNIGHIRAEIAAVRAEVGKPEAEGVVEFWQVMRPFGTMPPPVDFTTTESAFILSTKDRDLMLTAMELADVHNNFLGLVTAYSERREALASLFTVEAVHGNYATSALNQEETNRLMPRIIQIRSLTAAMISRGEQDYDQARLVFDHLKAYCSKRFGKDFPSFEITPEERLASGPHVGSSQA
jgi:hypothetical protein